MDDQQLFDFGLLRLQEKCKALTSESTAILGRLLLDYRRQKETLAAIVAGVGSAAICAECSGKCCLNGKYRLNVLDGLALLAGKVFIAADFGQKPFCPYGNASGCIMEVGLRPADCVLFICDAIHDKLTPEELELLSVAEKKLRVLIGEATRLAGISAGTPLLLWIARLQQK